MRQVGCTNVGLYRQIFAGISASMGAFSAATLFSWVTPILPSLLSPDSEIPMTPQQASWMVSFAEIANLFTPIPSGILADKIGRKPMILLSAPLFTVGWIIILYFKTYDSLLVARSFQGAAVGIVFTVIPVYLGEIASTHYRGAISSLFFIFSWVGCLFEYCTGPFMSFTNYTLLTLVTTLVYFVMIYFQPESPYFYLMKGKNEEAYRSLMWFRNSNDSVIQELDIMRINIEEDQKKKTSWKDVVATSVDRKALSLMLFAGSLRILSGTYVLITYATENFKIASNFVLEPKYITIMLGLILVLGACFSFFILDTLGRRTLIIASSIGSCISLFAAGLYYYLESNTTIDVAPYSWVAPLAILIFAGLEVVGLFPVHTAYTAELFSCKTRSIAASVSAVLTTFFTLLTLKLYQNVIDIFGVYLNFFFFSMVCLIGAIVSYMFMPETKNKTFQQIREELSSNKRK